MSKDDDDNDSKHEDFETKIEIFIELAEVHYDDVTNLCNKSTQISDSMRAPSSAQQQAADSDFSSLEKRLHSQLQVDLLEIHDRIEEAMKGMDDIQKAVQRRVVHYPQLAHETLMHCQLCRRVYATCNDSDMEAVGERGADSALLEVNSDRVTALGALRASISQVRNIQFLELTLEDAGASDFDDDDDDDGSY